MTNDNKDDRWPYWNEAATTSMVATTAVVLLTNIESFYCSSISIINTFCRPKRVHKILKIFAWYLSCINLHSISIYHSLDVESNSIRSECEVSWSVSRRTLYMRLHIDEELLNNDRYYTTSIHWLQTTLNRTSKFFFSFIFVEPFWTAMAVALPIWLQNTCMSMLRVFASHFDTEKYIKRTLSTFGRQMQCEEERTRTWKFFVRPSILPTRRHYC